jgi:hypothetical protein
VRYKSNDNKKKSRIFCLSEKTRRNLGGPYRQEKRLKTLGTGEFFKRFKHK